MPATLLSFSTTLLRQAIHGPVGLNEILTAKLTTFLWKRSTTRPPDLLLETIVKEKSFILNFVDVNKLKCILTQRLI